MSAFTNEKTQLFFKKDEYRIEFQIQTYKKSASDIVLIQIPKYVDF
jgi:hypothetical protein